ncbi:MAG: DUF4185 domain-containing protein [Deltaproteobacteria bacterium]|nr:DUF4185 domain-containing protein [Deltaproteobacteria bacterium]MBK8237178.1 DUF4185 domain-containing protein [Deltaproteobacteria bacterium]MBK8718870.1 DUF4185 domain-containing protein [Deltaproteobacteria bacterium]MBP7291971.1 DUF4185 domain-containing protein [Nannocystaceae bacterium]
MRRRSHWAALLLALACEAVAPSGPEVVEAREIGVLGDSGLIDGRDGGPSAVLWGHDVWTFGDTVLRVPDVDGQNWHHNSFSITADLDASDGISGLHEPLDAVGAPLYLVPPTPAEKAFNDAHLGDPCAQTPCGARWAAWPSAPVYDVDRDRALIFYGLIYAEPGPFNFEGAGGSIAIWDRLDAVVRRPEIDAGAEHPTLMFRAGDPSFGISPHIEGDHLYSFACDEHRGTHVCRIGRVPVEQALDRSAWRMWGGNDYDADLEHGTVLFEAAPIASITPLPATGEWLAVYSPPFDTTIVARTAPTRTGPWSAPSRVYRVPAGEPAPYDAQHHAELAEDGGVVQYVTYSRPTEGWFGSEFAIVRVELVP